MADATVNLVNQTAVVVPFGSESILPLVSAAAASNTSAAAWAAAAQTYAASIKGQIEPIFPDDGYAGGFFGTDGYPVLSALLAGGLTGLIGNLPTAEYVFPDDGYQLAFAGSDGSVLFGTSLTSPNANYTGLQPVIDTDGSLRLISDTTDIRIAAAQGSILPPPRVIGTSLKWIDKQGGTRERRQFNLAAPWVPGSYTKLIMVPMTGQSLAIGAVSGALYTTSAVAPGRALMFNGGARVVAGPNWLNGNDNAKVLADTQTLNLVDLVETLSSTYGETQLSGMAAWLTKAGVTEATSALLFDTVGLGSSPLSVLSKGTQVYANLLRSIERGKAIADYLGIAFEVPCVVIDQGESDYSNSAAAYTTNLLQFQSDLTTDINAITGSSGQVKLLCWAPSSWTATAFGLATSKVPGAILDAAIAYPTRIAVIGAQYDNAYYAADGVHHLSRGYRIDGEKGGRAVAALRAGGSTGALYATAAAVVGTALTVTFNASIALDTTLVSNPGQYGVRLVNGSGTEITISSIAVSGNQLTGTVASAPTGGGWLIGIADKGTINNAGGPTTGPRSNIRDASTDLAADGTTNLYNWAMHQQIACAVS